VVPVDWLWVVVFGRDPEIVKLETNRRPQRPWAIWTRQNAPKGATDSSPGFLTLGRKRDTPEVAFEARPKPINCATKMKHRLATRNDAQLLGELNHQLIQDEGHRNGMTIPQLVDRMRAWLDTDYQASIFTDGTSVVAYALYWEEKDYLYLRQFFVRRDRRGSGVGRECVRILFSEVWPKDKRITVDVLCWNPAGIAFWRAMGFTDYCLNLEIYPDLKSKTSKAVS